MVSSSSRGGDSTSTAQNSKSEALNPKPGNEVPETGTEKHQLKTQNHALSNANGSKLKTLFAQVVVDSTAISLAESYTYRVPDHCRNAITVGSPVLVPFGNRIVGGYVVELSHETTHPDAKEIYQPVDAASFFSASFLDMLKEVADYYGVSLASVFHSALPSGIFEKSRKVILPAKEKEEIESLLPSLPEHLQEFLKMANRGPLDLKKELHAGRRALIQQLQERGLIKVTLELGRPAVRVKTRRWVKYLSLPENLTSRQSEIVESLVSNGGELPLDRFTDLSRTTLPTLKKLADCGAVLLFEKEELRNPLHGLEREEGEEFTLTPAQQKAIQFLSGQLDQVHRLKEGEPSEEKEGPKPNLLFGVTGSGKTEIYLQTIKKALSRGMDALVLVPEIALTPQTISRFRSRFGDQIAVLHSHLSPGERFDEWRRIRRGDVKIAIGARSAIFAPFQNLGLIVIDEEHETSFKQNNAPRYDARHVAVRRGVLEKALIVMGSATPRLDSYFKANGGDWNLLELPERVMERVMPPVAVVDMREELVTGNRSIFSRALREGLEATLVNGEQAILMINRRGFSTFIQCRRCGFVAKCPDCSISLVYHQDESRIKCHYCSHTEPVPVICPECSSSYIRHFGLGTERLEMELKKAFPQARVARMDQDTTRTKDAHLRITQSFKKHETDILIGTQMVAKGFDFPKVSLVGVLSADLALNFPDYAASERTFQLLSQVAGRAGRGDIAGQVIIQTYTPNHPSVQAAKDHDYPTFYHKEIEERRILAYPPFAQLVNLVLSGPQEEVVRSLIERLHGFLLEGKTDPGVSLLGPAPAAHARLKGLYRYQILIKDPGFSHGRHLAARLRNFRLPSGCRLQVDVDPTDLL